MALGEALSLYIKYPASKEPDEALLVKMVRRFGRAKGKGACFHVVVDRWQRVLDEDGLPIDRIAVDATLGR
ncbi:MAG: hypothetical protein JSV26_12540 [bacterium]|nr:MAG: hypothetical protein JSV26_12540 [bacterium]